jgi:MATE family multidrug resistance protein
VTTAYGFASGCDTLFPQLFGSNDKKKIGVVLQKALLIGLINVFVSGTMILNASNLLARFVESKDVIK